MLSKKLPSHFFSCLSILVILFAITTNHNALGQAPQTGKPNLINRISSDVCSCMTSKESKSLEETFNGFEMCSKETLAKYKEELTPLAEAVKDPNLSEARNASKFRRTISNQVERVMVDSCDKFYHMIDSTTLSFFKQENVEKAKKKLAETDSLFRKTNSAFFLSERAMAYATLQDYKNALIDTHTVLEMDSMRTEAHRLRSMIYQVLGDLPAAKAELEIAIRKKNDPSTEMFLAVLNRKL